MWNKANVSTHVYNVGDKVNFVDIYSMYVKIINNVLMLNKASEYTLYNVSHGDKNEIWCNKRWDKRY